MDERIEELFPFYAMGAVTEEEMAEVEAYVRDNPAAQARLEAAMATADELAFLAEPKTPAASVKENVLAYAHRRPHMTASAATPQPLSWWQRFRQSMAIPAFAGLATVTAILLFIWVLSLQRTIADLDNRVTALQQALEQRDTILAVLPEGRGLSIAGTEHQPNATGQLLVGADGQTAVLAVSNLEPLPSEQTYQLWLIGDSGVVSEGVFTVDAEGTSILEVETEAAVFSYTTIGVSVEPQGGSLQPTGDIVMHGEITSPGTDS